LIAGWRQRCHAFYTCGPSWQSSPRPVSIEDMKSGGIRWRRLCDSKCWREQRSSQRKKIPPVQRMLDIVTFTLGGATVLSNSVTPITYTVNADCTGSYTVPNGPSFGLFIAPDGESIATIATGPPGNEVSGISKRVSRR
jgi:hypothetical protein